MEVAALPDGRAVEYAVIGDPRGDPVLFCHGTPQTAEGASRLLDALAREAGCRVVVPSRPGYGGSAPSSPGISAAAADLVALADQLDLARFGIVGASGGGAFALGAAIAAGDRVRGVGVLAGAGPFTKLTPPSDEDAAERAAVARYDGGDAEGGVAALTASAEEEFGAMREMETADLNAVLSANRPAEDTWFREHTEGSLILTADLRRAIQRPHGYVRDVLSWGGDWDVDLADVRGRVRLVYGADDVAVPVLHGEWLRQQLTNAEVSFDVVGGGHADVAFGQFPDTLRFVVGGTT